MAMYSWEPPDDMGLQQVHGYYETKWIRTNKSAEIDQQVPASIC